MPKASKGSAFERRICKQLSLWWTEGDRDDVFWRTSGSGARATVRRHKGTSTYGQSGDIQAVDPIGEPFCRLFSVEMKRGYKTATASNVLDASEGMKPQPLLEFVEQAERDLANSEWFMVIHKRDQREPTVTLPPDAVEQIDEAIRIWFSPDPQCSLSAIVPSLKIQTPHPGQSATGRQQCRHQYLFQTTLTAFLSSVPPDVIQFIVGSS